MGSGTVTNLIAAGIRTAADFTGVRYVQGSRYGNRDAYLIRSNGHQVKIPGVGEVRAAALESWRGSLEQRARKLAPTSVGVQERAAIRQQFAAQKKKYEAEITQAEDAARHKRDQLQQRVTTRLQGQPPRRRNVLSVIDWAVEAVADYVENVRPRFGCEDHPALWVTERGGRIKPAEINARFVAYRDALKLPKELTVHSARHAYVTRLTEDGVDRRFLQLLLSPQQCVHDVQHEPGAGGDLCGGGGYLPPSITQSSGRFDAGATGADARLAA